MSTQPPLTLEHERIDDVPLLLGVMARLHLAEVLDRHLPRHHAHQGLSSGTLASVWLAFILSQADHRKSAVQPWAEGLHHTLEQLTGQTLRPQEFTDDRLGLLLRRLAAADWDALEEDLFRATCQVYELPLDSVRLDATTCCGYHTASDDGLMQLGHSKDHRPDLAQLKLMAAAAQPAGQLLACDIRPGDDADDPLYLPLIERVRGLLGRTGLLYVGDCKMAALATRAAVADAGDYYLLPLPLTGATAQQFPGWVEAALDGTQALVPLFRADPDGQSQEVGQGYEFTRTCQGTVDARAVEWLERVQVLRSTSLAQRQQHALEERLQRAEQQVRQLTPAPGPGRRVCREEESLRQAVAAVLERHRVAGLLEVRWQRLQTQTTRYEGPGRPGPGRAQRTAVEVRYQVSQVQRHEARIEAEKARLGWRVQVSNAPVGRLTLQQAVDTYREGWSLERDFHLLKDKPLGISPLWVREDDQIVGLTRLLTIALRLLTLVELQVRAGLEQTQEQLPGLYEGQASRREGRPTATRLLKAVVRLGMTLTRVEVAGQVRWHVTTVSPLLGRILQLLGLSPTLYTGLTFNSG